GRAHDHLHHARRDAGAGPQGAQPRQLRPRGPAGGEVPGDQDRRPLHHGRRAGAVTPKAHGRLSVGFLHVNGHTSPERTFAGTSPIQKYASAPSRPATRPGERAHPPPPVWKSPSPARHHAPPPKSFPSPASPSASSQISPPYCPSSMIR